METHKMHRYLIQDCTEPNAHLAVSERTVTQPYSLHWHNYLELELVTDGCGHQTLNGKQLTLSRGSLSLLRLNDFHQVEPSGQIKLINMVIDDRMLSPELLSRLSSRAMLYSQADEEETQTLEQLLQLCRQELSTAFADQRYLDHLVTCILLRVLRLVPATKSVFPTDHPIQSVLLYLHMHFRENPTLKDCAEIAHYNASYFSTVFHNELGITYSEYLNLLKISYAKELLLSTELKISDICYECGFTSHANFLKAFQKKEGCSPLTYRNRMQQLATSSAKTVEVPHLQ